MEFSVFLISDEVNGLLEIHTDEALANQALKSFIEEGNAFNEEHGSNEKAEDFFTVEEIKVASQEDLNEIFLEYGEKSGQFGLDVLFELKERGLISQSQYCTAKEA